MSSFTLPFATGASPAKARIAASRLRRLRRPGAPAAACRSSSAAASTQDVAACRQCHRLLSVVAISRTSVAQGREKGHHVFDLFGGQHGLAAQRGADPLQPVGPVIGGMMVSGLSRGCSTSRSRNCPSDQPRARRPQGSGARSPWNRSSGNGPVWHSRQSPLCRLATMARPARRIARLPVSDCGMASPTTRRPQRTAARRPRQRQTAAACQRRCADVSRRLPP